MEWTLTELIRHEQEKRSPHRNIPLSPSYRPPSQRNHLSRRLRGCVPPTDSPSPWPWHSFSAPTQDRGPPSWTSRAKMHFALLVARHPAHLHFPNLCPAFHFEWKENKFRNKLWKKRPYLRSAYWYRLFLYRVCNFKISGMITSVFNVSPS